MRPNRLFLHNLEDPRWQRAHRFFGDIHWIPAKSPASFPRTREVLCFNSRCFLRRRINTSLLWARSFLSVECLTWLREALEIREWVRQDCVNVWVHRVQGLHKRDQKIEKWSNLANKPSEQGGGHRCGLNFHHSQSVSFGSNIFFTLTRNVVKLESNSLRNESAYSNGSAMDLTRPL